MHQNLCSSATIATLIYLEHLLKQFISSKLLSEFSFEPFPAAKAKEAGLLQTVTGHIGSQNILLFWRTSHPLNTKRCSFGKKICEEKRGEDSDGTNNLHSENYHLTLLILQLAKCLLCFLCLVASFQIRKTKVNANSHVQLQGHSIVYQLKRLCTVSRGPATILLSNNELVILFTGFHLWETETCNKMFLFSCCIYFVLLKKISK